MKLLHIDSSILGEGSASRTVSAAVVDQFRQAHADLAVTYRDLVADPLPHLTQDVWTSLDTGADVQQFLDSDVVVIGAGFYNFSIPSQLKSWIDRIAVRGKTFAYGENGPVGLATGTRVIICLARGNVYGAGTPYAAYEHGETLLRALFGFIGANVEFIIAEGIGFGEDARRASIDGAVAQAGQIAKTVPETANA
jgi:FMN-dependent NADH-azoreductase